MQAAETFQISLIVRFRDLDALGHVNNAVMMTYFEEGRKQFFQDHFDLKKANAFNFIMARSECDYLLPVQLHDRLLLQMQTTRIGNKSFDFSYRLVDETDPRRVFARGKTVQVCYDYRAAKTIAVPESMAVVLKRFAPSKPE